ncbi:hypothetical protein Lal_00030002 [Lupinus albus]|nr:hypothetical protein Lal_00030002 [Lupinus albus]
MLLRNLDQANGLCNGTRLVVTRMAKYVLEAKIISGNNTRNTIYIPRIHEQLYVTISRVQSKKVLKMIHYKNFQPLKSTINVVYKDVFQNL